MPTRPSWKACSATSISTASQPGPDQGAQQAAEAPAGGFRRARAGPAAVAGGQPGRHRRHLRIPDWPVSPATRARRAASSTRRRRSRSCWPSWSRPGRATVSATRPAVGSLLIRVAQEVGDSDDFSLFGQEMNGSTWALCRMNMFLHDMDSARIEWGDTLASPKLIEGDALMKFDMVVANPPFSLDKWGADEAPRRTASTVSTAACRPRARADYAFISHMIETAMADEGKVGVIVPHGVLFRGGAGGRIRQAADRGEPARGGHRPAGEAVLRHGHPRRDSASSTRANKTKDVLFIDASREYRGRHEPEQAAGRRISRRSSRPTSASRRWRNTPTGQRSRRSRRTIST